MYTPLASKSGKLLPFAAICCLALIGFLIALTIVLALIPVYIPRKDVTVVETPDDNSTLYVQYSASADSDTSVSGQIEDTSSIETALGLAGDATVGEAYTAGTYDRRRRSGDNPREKRALKVLILVVIKFATTAKCNTGPCLTALRTKVKAKIQKAGNIKSFPCSVRSAGVLKSLKFDTTFLGFISASTARLGFRPVTSLSFVAIKTGPFNDPTTWAGGVVPFGNCSIVIPSSITVSIPRTALEFPVRLIEVYGTFAVGSGNSPFTFNYSTNIIAYSGGVLQLLSTSKTLLLPASSIITVRTGGSFSSAGVVIQSYTSSGVVNSTTITTPSGPLTCGVLPSGELLAFNKVTVIAIKSGGFTLGSTFLGGVAPTAESCSESSACDLYIPSGVTLSTSDLDGELNMNFETITVALGGILELGTSGSSKGFRFKYPCKLNIRGKLSFLGIAGAGIYLPFGSSFNLLPGGSFISEVITFIQVYNRLTGLNVGNPQRLLRSIDGPYYITISSIGFIFISITVPGGSDTTTISNLSTTSDPSTTTSDTTTANVVG